jgi:hypothetical protein
MVMTCGTFVAAMIMTCGTFVAAMLMTCGTFVAAMVMTCGCNIDILYTLDSASNYSAIQKLKP